MVHHNFFPYFFIIWNSFLILISHNIFIFSTHKSFSFIWEERLKWNLTFIWKVGKISQLHGCSDIYLRSCFVCKCIYRFVCIIWYYRILNNANTNFEYSIYEINQKYQCIYWLKYNLCLSILLLWLTVIYWCKYYNIIVTSIFESKLEVFNF